MIQIAVCDGSKKDTDLLVGHISSYTESKGIHIKVQCFKTGMALVDTILKDNIKYDIIFLEAILTGMNGIETAEKIRKADQDVPIVYLTTSREYAVESYEVGAAGYMIKPFDTEKINKCLDKFIDNKPDKYLVVKVQGEAKFINYKNIMYLESYGHYVNMHLVDDCFPVLGKLCDYEEQLDDKRFLRCHQSYLVNMDYITEAKEYFVLSDNTEIPIRVRQKKKISDQCMRYWKEKNEH